MKILIMSQAGAGIGIASRLASEGNTVYLFIKHGKVEKVGGWVAPISAWRPVLPEVDMVICDGQGFGHLETTFKKFGKPVLGCSKIGDVTKDKWKALEVMSRSGLNVPEAQAFTSPLDARVGRGPWNDPGYKVYSQQCPGVPVNSEDELEWLLGGLGDHPVYLQTLVEGIEVVTEGWFNGRGWVRPFSHSFIQREAYDGGKGPDVGCSGMVKIMGGEDSLVHETLSKMEPFLENIGYKGPISVTNVVDEQGVCTTDMHVGFSYDSSECLLEGLQEDAGDLFFEVATGVRKDIKIGRDYLISARLTVPLWPFSGDTDGRPISGINERNLNHLFLIGVEADNGKYWSAGSSLTLKATAKGRDIREARNRVYRTLNNVQVQGKYFRADIGQGVEGDMRMLRDWL